jgi:hypothetical protein
MRNLSKHLEEINGKRKINLEEINSFAPFCHGTNEFGEDQIDAKGLRPRKFACEEVRPSEYEEAGCPSKEDRVYLASVQQGGQCLGAMVNAYENEGMVDLDALNLGVFYVLEEIPREYLNDLTIDEDCRLLEKGCNTPLRSLELVGSLGIRRSIPREKLRKLNTREFFKLMKEHNVPDLPDTWEKFVEEYIRERSGEEAVKWTWEHFPKVFKE